MRIILHRLGTTMSELEGTVDSCLHKALRKNFQLYKDMRLKLLTHYTNRRLYIKTVKSEFLIQCSNYRVQLYLKQADEAIVCQSPTTSDIQSSKNNNIMVTATAAASTNIYVVIVLAA